MIKTVLNRALYRITRIPSPADHQTAIQTLSSLLSGWSDLLSARSKAPQKTAPARPRTKSPPIRRSA